MGTESETDTTTETKDSDRKSSDKTRDGFKSDEARDRVLADLRAERDRRQQLEVKLKELEDAEKSEVDKLRDEVETLRASAAKHEAAALRAEVAMAKGLTAGQAKRLQGATREELETDADEILEAFPAASGAKPPPSNKPSPDLKGGTDPTSAPEEMNPAKLASGLPRF